MWWTGHVLRFSQHRKNNMSEEFCFLLCVMTASHQTFIIISSASSKHQMPQCKATLTVSGHLPSTPWDICIYSLTWITLFSLHLFEMTRQLPTSTLCLSGPDHCLVTIQISLWLLHITLFLTPVMHIVFYTFVLFVCRTMWINLVCLFHW